MSNKNIEEEDWVKELNLEADGLEEAKEANKEQVDSLSNRKRDQRFWKPSLKQEGGEIDEYEAQVRILPPSTGWLEDRLMPWSIKVQTHYVKDDKNPKLGFTVKCRKTLGQDEICPICEYNWKVWREANARNDKALMIKMTKRGNKVSHIGNVLIVNDMVHPELNGEVKLWDHTDRMSGWLNAPMRPEPVKKKEDEEKKTLREKKAFESFNALHPIKGRDYLVVVQQPEKKGEPLNYDESGYLKEATSIANSKDNLIAMLERCYPLDEFIKDVKSIEELEAIYSKFRAESGEGSGTTVVVDGISQSVPDITNLSPGVSKPSIDKGNADVLFEDKSESNTEVSVKKENVVEKPKESTVIEAPADEDDDLPF